MKKDTHSLINALSHGPVRQYLTDHEHADLRDIILKNKELFGIPASKIFEQIEVRRKAKEKLPLYYHTPNIVYPPRENFEQTSSETTAQFKGGLVASMISRRSTAVDLTGGFGVDTYFLSTHFETFHMIEPDKSLLEIAQFDHKLLGATNIEYHVSTAEQFLEATSHEFDFVYIDPSRRKSQKRVVGFEDSSPDIVKLAPSILEKCPVMMVKASPLLDLKAGMSQLPSVKSIAVVSVNNECKEVLFVCSRDYRGSVNIQAVNLQSSGAVSNFTFTFAEEESAEIEYGEIEQYLYEPNASILKAGAFKAVGRRYSLRKLHPNTHLYTSSSLVSDFPGKIFQIEAIVRPQPGEIKKYIPEGQANVTTRNYPLTPVELKKKTGVKDGGDKFIIGFTGRERKYVVVASRL